MAEQRGSRIYVGSRVLGYVSTHVPLVVRFIKRRGENLVVTSVGRWFHTYGCDHFRLLSVSGEHPGQITCMSGDSYHIYTASENNVYAWRRGCEIKHVYKGHTAEIHLMLPFGPHLISIDKNNILIVWDIKMEHIHLELPFEADNFKITTITHPPTYLNKILLGSHQGNLQLWNLRTSKLIYTFTGWNSPVLVLEPAPAVDVVAIALADHRIILHNLKVDESIMKFTHDWGSVASLSFRLDGQPIMVSASTDGHIVMWDLEERRVMSQVEMAHKESISGLKCLMSEPLMITNSGDNSLKMWIFDLPDGGARLLKLREGHSAPPSLINFCERTGTNILSAGSDSSLHIMNTVSETFNKNLGKASYCRKASKKKKRTEEDNLILPPITKLSSCMQRDKEWDSIATLHKGMYMATTWSYNKKRMGDHKLKPPKFEKGVEATCLRVSHCGNFVVIGYSNGQVHKFNMQSGIYRGHFGDDTKVAHKGALRGVETDLYNQRVISCGSDDKIKFWHFRKEKLPYFVMKLDRSVTFTILQRESGLLALSNEDFTITMMDIDTTLIVRRFDGHNGIICDMTFDPQSRWLISCSMDCTICTWDIPSCSLVDIFQVSEPATSISMSPNGDFVATTHVGESGIYLWANKTIYQRIYLKPIDKDTFNIPAIRLPHSAPEAVKLEDDLMSMGIEEDEYKSPEQLSDELITLSGLSTSRWVNLLNLDVIKKRNKPKQPLQVPKSAPFFLPTVSNLETAFDLTDEIEKIKETKLLFPDNFTTLTEFGKMLVNCQTDDFGKCIEKLKAFSPSLIEVEIRNLYVDEQNFGPLKKFLDLIFYMLKTNKNFELAQSYLSLFLKIHCKSLSKEAKIQEILDSVQEVEEKSWSRLQTLLLYNICVVKSLKYM